MKKSFLFVFVILLAARLSAQTASTNLSGSLTFDSKLSFDSTKIMSDETKLQQVEGKKSVLLASVLSFAIPGAGEFYTENYLKSVVFIAFEAAAITVGLIYDAKGNDQTDKFQNYANQNWDPAKYASLSIKNFGLNASDYPNLFTDETQTKIKDWNAIRLLENDVANLPGGTYYSHNLARYGDQQYYEMIGKYDQFNSGWNDFVFNETTPFKFGDPVTNNFEYYSVERGKANDYYNVASKAVMIIVVNHIVSAIDAALSARSFNKKLEMNVSLEKENFGAFVETYPQLNIRYSF